MYFLLEDMEVKAKLSTSARRLEELELRNQHGVRTVVETPVPNGFASFVSLLSIQESIAQLFLQ